MSLKIWLINFFLVSGVIFFGLKAYGVWSEVKKSPLEIGSMKEALPGSEKKTAKKEMSPESEYKIIVDNSLFWSDRSAQRPEKPKEPQATTAKAKADGRLLKELQRSYQLTNLYGVIVVDDRREALIGEVPAGTGTSVGERGVKRARIGDTVGRFKVKEIRDASVLLTAEGHEWQVSLFDKDKPKKRPQVKKNNGPIVIVGGSKMGSILKEAKAVEKRPTPTPEVSKKETLPKAQDKKKTIPVPTDKTKTNKR